MHGSQLLLEALRQSPKILSEFVHSIPQDKLHLRRGEGYWTIAEHLTHLAHVQPILLQRFEQFMQEADPQIAPYDPTKLMETPETATMDTASALYQVSRYRDMQLMLLGKAGDAMWTKTATHPEYETYSLHILTRHVLMHDYWHMYRMEELWLAKDQFLKNLE